MDLSLCVHSSGFARQLLTGGRKEILANVSKSGRIYPTILSLTIISIDFASFSSVFSTTSLAFCYHIIISKKIRINVNTALQFLIFCVTYSHLCTGFGYTHFCSLLSLKKLGGKKVQPYDSRNFWKIQ